MVPNQSTTVPNTSKVRAFTPSNAMTSALVPFNSQDQCIARHVARPLNPPWEAAHHRNPRGRAGGRQGGRVVRPPRDDPIEEAFSEGPGALPRGRQNFFGFFSRARAHERAPNTINSIADIALPRCAPG